MPSPVKQSDVTPLLPSENEPLWSLIVKLFRAMFIGWRWKKYAFNSDGTMTDGFKTDLCEAKSRTITTST